MLTKDLMTSNVVTVNPENSIWHAAQIMLDRDVSGLPVIDDDGDLVGILTEGDLLSRIELGITFPAGIGPANAEPLRINAYLKSLSWKVGDVMTTQLVVADEEAPLSRLASLMDKHKIRRIPVVHKKKLVGIVSRRDLLRAIAVPSLHDIAPGDAAMQRSILTRLGEINDLHSVQLTVSVSDGVVHLGGIVGSDAERCLARVVAESIRGVGAVCDNMQVVEGHIGVSNSKPSDR
jgi:CBS domain-containing protein